ncbi:unnamed protein product [Arctogadus glacialis]
MEAENDVRARGLSARCHVDYLTNDPLEMCAVPGVLSECAPSGDDAQLGLAAQRSLEGPGTQASSIHLCPKPKVNVTFISN